MPTIKLVTDEEEIEAEAVYERVIKKFGRSSGHLIVPSKWIGYTAKVIVEPLVGQWAAGYAKAARALSREDSRKPARKIRN